MEIKNNNYKLIKKQEIKDVEGTGYLLEHIKTKARVALIECDDTNKVFSISFRTTPQNDKGTPHIMEHSVLCGSKNFPVKDPFAELCKGSLNTFLNAMTFPDKTMYPVASCNDKDFHNLMHVYLDAVFYPNIYKHKEIFEQEGWSYDLDSKEGELKYNGVVYNEMKGAFSSPEGMLERMIFSKLFPDNCYGKESGGDPEFIPDLTYEEFLDFHKEFYHPSNSYIYLYGNVDFESELDFIDREYLSSFEYRNVDSKVSKQESFDKPLKVEAKYPVLNVTDKLTYYSYNKVINNQNDAKKLSAFIVAMNALVDMPGSPVEKALLEAGIGEQILSTIEGEIAQPYFSIVSKNAPTNKLGEFISIIDNVISKQVEKGFDKEAIKSSLIASRFRLKEKDFGNYPAGLEYNRCMLITWLYDDNKPFDNLNKMEINDSLLELVDSNYFEEAVRELWLDNNHTLELTLKPDDKIEKELDDRIKTKLDEYKKSFSDDELNEIIANKQKLIKYKQSVSSPEDLAKIPFLQREDISRKIKKRSIVVEKGNPTYIIHNNNTNGIDYVEMHFEIGHIGSANWSKIELLTGVLGMLDTANYSYNDLMKKMMMDTGGLRFSIYPYTLPDGKTGARFSIKAKCLEGNLDKMFNLIQEILFNTNFDDNERLNELINMAYARQQSAIYFSPHIISSNRSVAHFRNTNTFTDKTKGIDYYLYLNKYKNLKRDETVKLGSELRELLKSLLNTNGVNISLAGADSEIIKAKSLYNKFIDKVQEFGGKNYELCELEKTTISNLKEAFVIPTKVGYVAQGGRFDTNKYPYTGAIKVLRTMLAFGYLWNNVREIGGAYGCMSRTTKFGNAYFVSYRDPQLINTLKVYNGLPEYLENLEITYDQLSQFVIGTMGTVDAPLSVPDQISRDNDLFFTLETEEDEQKTRDEILDVTPDDIKKLSLYYKEVLELGSICVISSREIINNHQELFDEIIELN